MQITDMYHEQNSSQPEQTGCDNLTATSLQVLDQLCEAIARLTQDQYVKGIKVEASSIGEHVRHVIEFYQALFNALLSTGGIELCYDKRKRNFLLETSKDAALQELTNIQADILAMSNKDFDLTMHSIVDPNAPMIKMRTTQQRELFYLLDHTIHHMAVIKMLAEQYGVIFSKNFGLAQSTQAHENSKP